MGRSETHQTEGGFEKESNKWVVGGIPLRVPLKPINTKKTPLPPPPESAEEECCCDCTTTPKEAEARIPEMGCPPAPKKRRPLSRCGNGGGEDAVVREFFSPPDLDSVFVPR
ncbi:hypothetical protein QJS04_geneDACA002750 [Acorus gramineus]|uniref:Uncharacterized protein n=1 Tax=Acorus gramineus TaxID=55184 RepID=A0AAV9BY62_ACOGR|nr:hypothetical protein QJS04_geneDACA002750 [Acorus gramineus]